MSHEVLSPQQFDLYHFTSPEAAERIHRTGQWLSKENTQSVYFSTDPKGQATGYGEAVVHVRVPRHWAQLDDEFPSGEQHYTVPIRRLRPHHIVRD